MDELVAQVRHAVRDGDTAALRLLLHPYLHWTEPGLKLHGRTKVLAHLATVPSVGDPADCELRDGQIYRWTIT